VQKEIERGLRWLVIPVRCLKAHVGVAQINRRGWAWVIQDIFEGGVEFLEHSDWLVADELDMFDYLSTP